MRRMAAQGVLRVSVVIVSIVMPFSIMIKRSMTVVTMAVMIRMVSPCIVPAMILVIIVMRLVLIYVLWLMMLGIHMMRLVMLYMLWRMMLAVNMMRLVLIIAIMVTIVVIIVVIVVVVVIAIWWDTASERQQVNHPKQNWQCSFHRFDPPYVHSDLSDILS